MALSRPPEIRSTTAPPTLSLGEQRRIPVPFQFPGFQGQADLGRLWNPFGIRRRCSLRCSHRCRYFQNRFHLCWRNQADSVRRCLLGHQFRFRRPCFQNRCRRVSFRTNCRNDCRRTHCLRQRCSSQNCPRDRCAAAHRREPSLVGSSTGGESVFTLPLAYSQPQVVQSAWLSAALCPRTCWQNCWKVI